MSTQKEDKNAPAGNLDVLAGVQTTGNPAEDGKAEASALLKGFKDRINQENDRRALATDPEYYFCVFFHSRAQKEEFLAKAGWSEMGDKYLDGGKLAAKMGIALTKVEITFHEEQKDKMTTENLKPIGGE